MATVLGIDLGSHTVKVAVFDGGFGRFQLKEYWSRPVPQRMEAAPDMDARLDTLQHLLDELPGKEPPVVVAGFPTERASVRLVKLPFADRSQVERTLPVEVEGQIPFDLEDVVLMHRILQLAAGNSLVLVALADREAIQETLDAYRRHRLDPRHLFVDADLLAQLAGRGVQAIVDFGHSRTLVTLCRDGKVLAARALEGGGRVLTLAIATARGLTLDEAEARKLAARLPDATLVGSVEVEWDEENTNPGAQPQPPSAVRQLGPAGSADLDDGLLLLDAIMPTLAELKSTLIAFEDSAEVEVDELLVVGGGAQLAGLRELLAAELGVPVRAARISEAADDLDAPGSFALAHALGEKATGKGHGRELDVRVGAFVYRGDLGAYARWFGYAAVGIAAFLLVGVGLFAWRTWQLAQQRDEVEASIAAAVLEAWPDVDPTTVKDPTMAVAVMQEKSQAERERLEALSSIIAEEPPTLSLLKELSESVPSPADARIDVNELVITATSINMKAETDGFEHATRIEAALQENPKFEQATKGDSKKFGEAVKIVINIPLGEPELTDEEG